MIHLGVNVDTATLKGRFNLQAVPLFYRLGSQLNMPFVRNGSLVIVQNPEDRQVLLYALDKARKNGV